MGMTIDELITYCEEKEHNHRLSCKRYDDASGYTRSKDKNIRTACAIREDTYADFYKEIIETMCKYQMFQADYEARLKADMVAMLNEFDLELYEKYEDTDLIKVKYIRQAIQQKIDKLKEVEQIRAEIEQEYNKYRNMSDKWDERACGLGTALEIIDKALKKLNE